MPIYAKKRLKGVFSVGTCRKGEQGEVVSKGKLLEADSARVTMEVRSKTWTHPVEANFTNRSSRYVDLFWVDYQGALVRYHKRMAPNELKKLITFATHPWVARDSDTGQAMYLSGRPVYITSLQKEEKREPVEVLIHIPVYSLEDICIGFFRRHLDRSDMPLLGVNCFTLQRLTAVPQKPSKEYSQLRRRQN